MLVDTPDRMVRDARRRVERWRRGGAGVDGAGVRGAGVRGAGVREAGVSGAGVPEAGIGHTGVIRGAGVREAVARESAPAYDLGGAPVEGSGDERAWTRVLPPRVRGAVAQVDAGLDELVAAVDEADDLGIPQLHAALAQVQRHLSRSQSIRSRLTAALDRQEQAAAPPGRPDVGEQRAARFLKDRLQLPPGEAKRAAATGRGLASAPRTRDAFERGRVSEAHAAVIARRLAQVPEQHRHELETALVSSAQELHPAALDREAQRLVGQLDVAGLEAAARREQVQTRASWRRDDDGALLGSFRLYGMQAETMETALHAATSRRAPDDHRSDDHRRAEALVRLAETTLRAGELPATHGIRPHVLVLVRAEDIARGYGTATLGSGATVPLTEAGRALSDCVVTRIVTDARGAPMEASVGARTVPVGLYKALLVRDGGCSWAACDVRAGWCQVAHGATPYGADGRLSIDNAALLCERHHQLFDAGGWLMDVEDGAVTYRRDPTRPPVWSIVADHRRARVDDPSRQAAPRSSTRPAWPTTPAGAAESARAVAPPESGAPTGPVAPSGAAAPARAVAPAGAAAPPEVTTPPTPAAQPPPIEPSPTAGVPGPDAAAGEARPVSSVVRPSPLANAPP